MGMGTAAAHATIIDQEDLLKLPTAGLMLAELLKYLEDNDLDDSVIEDIGHDDDLERLETHLFDFKEAFSQDTDLTIEPFYYDNDNGDRYDHFEESGIYWSVEGVYQLTAAAEKLKDILQDVQWTTYG